MPEFALVRERKYYEQETLWSRPLDGVNRHRVLTTLSAVPDDVVSVLDLGCGKGTITNHLLPDLKTTAFDLSAEALKYVAPDAARVQGSGLQLPFRDGAFDLVIASEVIEHFPDALEQALLAEIRRVARRYVLIGVPAEEDIAGATVTCPRCNCSYHPNHHHRSYTAAGMPTLTDWPLARLETCGGSRALVHPWLRGLGRAAGGTFETAHALCPSCTAPYPVAPSTLPSLVLKGLNLGWRRLTNRHKLRSHWVALYAAQGAPPAYGLGTRLQRRAEARMAALQAVYAFGRGLVTEGAVGYLVEGAQPGWNVLRWPAELMNALRSRAQLFVAGNLAGRLLAALAAGVRGGRALSTRKPLSARDFES